MKERTMTQAEFDAEGAHEAEKERAYIAGTRAVWTAVLQRALHELLVFEPGHETQGPESPNVTIAKLVLHEEQTRAALRRVCEDFGDNDWPDDLHLADVVDKHLMSYFEHEDDPLPDEER